MTESGPFLNAEEVGRQVGRSADTVRRWWDDGVLPCVEVAGRRVTPAGALDQWIAEQATRAMENVKETP